MRLLMLNEINEPFIVCEQILSDVKLELQRSFKLHQDFKSINDALSIIWEEFDELKDEIRAVKNQNQITVCQKERIKEEAIQLAAMSVKLIKYLEA